MMNFHSQFEDFNKSLSELYPTINSTPVTSQTSPSEAEFFECPVPGCGKIYRYKSEKERHLVTHNNSKNYKCTHPDCTKSFKRPDALKVHMQSHSDKPQFVCPVSSCANQFKDRPALKYHLTKHHAAELKLMGNSLEFQQALSNKISPKRREPRRKAQRDSEETPQQTVQIFTEDTPSETYNQTIYTSSSPLEERGFWEEDLISAEPRKILCTETDKRDFYLGDTISTCSSESIRPNMQQQDDSNVVEDIASLKSAYSQLAQENWVLKKELVEKMIIYTERKIDTKNLKAC